MRLSIFCVIGLLLAVEGASSQTPKTASPSPSPKPTLPEFRPALLGTGPDSLINRIDTAGLIKQGQKDAAIMFSCSVKKDGTVLSVSTYRGTPDSKLLEQEILKKLSAAANPKFIPAIYNHMPVGAIYYGTVTFAIVNDKPRL